jgi:hypothetical protein
MQMVDMPAAELEAELAKLERMKLTELRTYWLARWGYAPRLRSVTLLRHLVAWRLQVGAYGGLDQRTRALLRQNGPLRRPAPPSGSVLTREHRGVLHRVEVTDDGFEYAGATYDNLSAVAKAITGTHWNGPAFFGLRNEGGGQ